LLVDIQTPTGGGGALSSKLWAQARQKHMINVTVWSFLTTRRDPQCGHCRLAGGASKTSMEGDSGGVAARIPAWMPP
jgi:hypothetical protein